MTRELKVFGGCFDGRRRLICATTSKHAFGKLIGRRGKSLYDFCSETANAAELAVALERPGVVFQRDARNGGFDVDSYKEYK